MLHLHPTILPNYYTNYTNTTGTGPQGAKDNDYHLAIPNNSIQCKNMRSFVVVVVDVVVFVVVVAAANAGLCSGSSGKKVFSKIQFVSIKNR